MPAAPLPAPTIPPSQIQLTNHRLGRGSFGTVHRGYFSGSPVAIKICKLSTQTPPSPTSRSALIQFRRESARYTSLHHPCITQFFGVVSQPESHQLLLVTELMKGGSLYEALSSLRKAGIKRLPIDAMLRMALDITNGLAYLHASSFSFGDLKTMNVLLSGPPDLVRGTIPLDVKAKLCDFGLSRNLKHLVDSDAPLRPDETLIAARNGPAGTFAYMAPEAFNGLPVDDAEAPKRADIFALAVVLWELATMRKPWPGKQAFQLLKLVGIDGQRLKWGREVAWLPKGFVNLVEWCWKEDALQRPTVEQVATVLEDLKRDFESSHYEGLSSFDEDDRMVEFPHGTSRGELPILDDSEIQHVEEEVLSTDEFEHFRMRLGVGSGGESTEAREGDTELSDVTGELQPTASHSKMSDQEAQSLVRYVETEERTKSMLMLEAAGLDGDLEEEFDGFVESGVVDGGMVAYLEKEEKSKLVMLEGLTGPRDGCGDRVEECTGGEYENGKAGEYLATEESKKSTVVAAELKEPREGVEEKFEGLNLEDSGDHSGEHGGWEYLETEESAKMIMQMPTVMEEGRVEVEGELGDLLDKVWEEEQIDQGEETYVEELELSKSKLISPIGVESIGGVEKNLGAVKWGSKTVGGNMAAGGMSEKRVRSKSYLVPRVYSLELEVEMELEQLDRIPSKAPRFAVFDGEEEKTEENGNGDGVCGSLKRRSGNVAETEERVVDMRTRRMYEVGDVDWSGTEEELSRWEEGELDIEKSGVNMFSRPHFK